MLCQCLSMQLARARHFPTEGEKFSKEMLHCIQCPDGAGSRVSQSTHDLDATPSGSTMQADKVQILSKNLRIGGRWVQAKVLNGLDDNAVCAIWALSGIPSSIFTGLRSTRRTGKKRSVRACGAHLAGQAGGCSGAHRWRCMHEAAQQRLQHT